jgi:hypothetical protein
MFEFLVIVQHTRSDPAPILACGRRTSLRCHSHTLRAVFQHAFGSALPTEQKGRPRSARRPRHWFVRVAARVIPTLTAGRYLVGSVYNRFACRYHDSLAIELTLPCGRRWFKCPHVLVTLVHTLLW